MFDFLTWLAAGLAVGGAYALLTRGHHIPVVMPFVLGALGGFSAGWLALLLTADQWDAAFRPGLLGAAFAGAGVLILGYHLFQMSSAPRDEHFPRTQ